MAYNMKGFSGFGNSPLKQGKDKPAVVDATRVSKPREVTPLADPKDPNTWTDLSYSEKADRQFQVERERKFLKKSFPTKTHYKVGDLTRRLHQKGDIDKYGRIE